MRTLVGLVLLLVVSNRLEAQEEWIGRKVFFKEGAEVQLPGEKVDWRKVRVPATVTKVRDDWLWVGRGWVKKSLVISDNREAMQYMTERIQRSPSAYWYNNRGILRQELGELQDAIADYTEVIRLDPKAAAAYMNRGNAWSKKGEIDKAIGDYNEAIRLDPKYATVYYNRGIAWGSKGEWDKALADLNEAIRLDPKNVMAYTVRGTAWRIKGDLDKAIADFSEAIRVDPKYAIGYENRGST